MQNLSSQKQNKSKVTITKHLMEKGETGPLYAAVAGYTMDTFASPALSGFSTF